MNAARPLLLADERCPYAHRVRALLDHLGVEHDLTEAPRGSLPEGIDRWSPSGRIPLLVHGAVVISESRVMLEHIAEAFGYSAALPRELTLRTEHRQAMALMDGTLVPRLAGSAPPLHPARLDECARVLEATVCGTPVTPCLLAFHLAPLWLRFQWWRPEGAITRALRARTELSGWLDEAAALPAVVRTAPGTPDSVRDFETHALASSGGVGSHA